MRRVIACCVLCILAACGGDRATTGMMDALVTEMPEGFEPPIATNAESPVAYPLDLYESGIEGTVILRLFADANGTIVPDSTQVAEGSGYPQLDSAAVAGVSLMRFAPARREGRTVSTSFLQPVHFRQPDRSGVGNQQ